MGSMGCSSPVFLPPIFDYYVPRTVPEIKNPPDGCSGVMGFMVGIYVFKWERAEAYSYTGAVINVPQCRYKHTLLMDVGTKVPGG